MPPTREPRPPVRRDRRLPPVSAAADRAGEAGRDPGDGRHGGADAPQHEAVARRVAQSDPSLAGDPGHRHVPSGGTTSEPKLETANLARRQHRLPTPQRLRESTRAKLRGVTTRSKPSWAPCFSTRMPHSEPSRISTTRCSTKKAIARSLERWRP